MKKIYVLSTLILISGLSFSGCAVTDYITGLFKGDKSTEIEAPKVEEEIKTEEKVAEPVKESETTKIVEVKPEQEVKPAVEEKPVVIVEKEPEPVVEEPAEPEIPANILLIRFFQKI